MKETAAEALFLSGKGMSGAEIGALVGHKKDWANKLIVWARDGFVGKPFANADNSSKSSTGSPGIRSSLKDNDNFEEGDDDEGQEEDLAGFPETERSAGSWSANCSTKTRSKRTALSLRLA
jgi:hypothetical protein